jgi:hypothetical protein
MSEAGEKIKKLLYEIEDDRDFVKAVMLNAKTEDNWKILTEFIESKEDNSVERILLFSVALGETVEE